MVSPYGLKLAYIKKLNITTCVIILEKLMLVISKQTRDKAMCASEPEVFEKDYPETVEQIEKLFALHPDNGLPLITSRWGALAEGELFDILATEVNKDTFREYILDSIANESADMIMRCGTWRNDDRATPAEVLCHFQNLRNDAIEEILTELIHNIGVRV